MKEVKRSSPGTGRVNSVSNGRPTPAELGAMFDGGIASSGFVGRSRCNRIGS